MKNSIKLICSIFMLINLVSCENESINVPVEDQSAADLIEIIEIGTVEGSPFISTQYTIEEGENTEIIQESGYNINQVFSDGKMVLAEHTYLGELSKNVTYKYDEEDRLLTVETTDFYQNRIVLAEYNYLANSIEGTEKMTDFDNNVIYLKTFNFLLDSSNRIIRYQNEDNTEAWEAVYNGGNLLSCTNIGYGQEDGTVTFEYTSELATAPYQKDKFRFGSEWRNNLMLGKRGHYAFKTLADLGENYLQSYVFVRDLDGAEITMSMDYEFDNENRLIKHTANKIYYSTSIIGEYNYVYQ
ncbi:MAG: hypothetical protein BM564_11220 [Bacteroidetes bacterium MedPE-SWsnd-G2]|nr:MAG: hypothetical protein BM564_11220 [Bacteroidetes bacterium MedPE-SWsnd-G2]